MKNPKYPEQLYSSIFIYLACAFTIFGLLTFIGILKPSEKSMVQEPKAMGIIFLTVGIALFIIAIVFKSLAYGKEQIYIKLVNHGIKVNGTAEKVYIAKHISYWTKSPYRVLYTYTYQGKAYHHKSHLFWEKPNIKAKDLLEIYVNDSGKSALKI